MILGIDPSAHIETRAAGARFFVRGEEVEPISYIHDHNGVSMMRLRLWVDPYDGEKKPYGGGSVDLEKFLLLAKEGVSKGYSILLDFHYSDFWCDPAKQPIPKAWANLSFEQLVKTVGEYTKETLSRIKAEGIPLYAIQIGNEITNGMLWPMGKLEAEEGASCRKGYDALCQLLRSGSLAAREVYPQAKRVIHLERSFDKAIYKEFFDQLLAHDVPFEVIGMSYYPYWHGSFDQLFENVELMKSLYHKPIWIVETSYGFTEEPAYVEDEEWEPLVDEKIFVSDNVSRPYPLTQEGQEAFLENLIRLSVENEVEAIFYWEPFWLPLPGLCWATEEGQNYIHERRATHNEWANQCLFDYDGEATKGFYAYSVK